ncbi:F-box/LRR-repeat protein At3g58930 [Linum grandiflorum]
MIRNRSIDRLSDLPDCILHHILSFLETKSSVQTSVLSRKWISLWKYVPVLTFVHSSFESRSSFYRFVEQFLSLRSGTSIVTRVTADIGYNYGYNYWKKDLLDLDRIMKYAASHGIHVLELERTDIGNREVELWSRFQLLETLTLTSCNFDFADAAMDAFASFPRLETLKLVQCSSSRRALKVTGPKLLNLEIVWPRFDTLEIVAPKLQSFTLEINRLYTTKLDSSNWNLPSLNRANIALFGYKHYAFNHNVIVMKQFLEKSLLENLFKILHNVQALNLKVETVQMLIKTCNSTKHPLPPFTRLKYLNVKCPEGRVPDEVIRYFREVSPSEEDKRFTVEDPNGAKPNSVAAAVLTNSDSEKAFDRNRSMDRLSDLPDDILHHILSFLDDTRESVRTSVLSRRWTSVWKYVHVLSFLQRLNSNSGFERFVEQFLSLRSDSSSVTRVRARFLPRRHCKHLSDISRKKNLADTIMKYAASHGVHVLKLERTDVENSDVGLWSRFQLLTTLSLRYCKFIFGDQPIDAFANFPSLETLKLDTCFISTSVLKVTGPKLLHLVILWPSLGRLEIVAPSLRSINLKLNRSYTKLLDVSKWYLPSLDLAYIRFFGYEGRMSSDDDIAENQLLLDKMFKILHNVQELNVHVETFELLIQTCNFAEDQSSPFTRMKSLNLWRLEEGSLDDDIPDEVIRYFFGDSPSDVDKHFRVKKSKRVYYIVKI